MCRVKTFLGCASLESFGIVYGWLNLVILIIAAIVDGAVFLVSVYKRQGMPTLFKEKNHSSSSNSGSGFIPTGQYALICLLLFAFLAFSIFITHQFIEGVKNVSLL